MKVPEYLTNIIASFLRHRTFRTKIGTAYSTRRTLTAGVPQGSLLSPLLYNLYTADIPRTDGTTLCQYADDTAVLARAYETRTVVSRLQRAMDELERYCTQWRIEINAGKSTALLFSRRHRGTIDSVTIFDDNIPWKRTAKYLGVTLDARLNWTAHVKATKANYGKITGELRPLLCANSSMSTANKLRVYRTIVRPAITYAAPIWFYGLSKAQKKQLQTLQNKALRQAVGAPWFVASRYLHSDLGIQTVEEHIQAIAEKFLLSAEDHENPTVSTALDYTPNETMRFRRPKFVLDRSLDNIGR